MRATDPEIAEHVYALDRHLWQRLEPLRDESDVIGPADPARRNGITTLCSRRGGLASLWDEYQMLPRMPCLK